MGCIYFLRDKDGLCYVGKTTNITQRIYQHRYKTRHNTGSCISRILDKDFEYEILEDNVESNLLDKCEIKWYDYQKEKNGENLVNRQRPYLKQNINEMSKEELINLLESKYKTK